MSVYVDNEQIEWRGKKWSHLVSDSLDELHEFAAKIGLKREWFQKPPKARYPHYDVTAPMRLKALRMGAAEADRHKVTECVRKLRREWLEAHRV